jgi:HEPN domain-containing protein
MTERAERLRREVWRWLRLAREDLAAARHLANAAHLPHRVACLLAQQAAEKAVKAVLVAEDRTRRSCTIYGGCSNAALHL